MSQFFDGPAPTISVKKQTPIAHDLARLAALEGLALGGLLGAQLLVADGLHRLVHGGVIVAGVVFPAERRLVGKLLAPDEVLQAQLGRIHAELLRQDVHAALDGVGGLRDPQRAAVGDAARRLVGVDGIHHRVGDGKIVGARDDGEEAGRELGRVGAGIEAAVVGDRVHAQARDLAVLGGGDLGRHVVVARERGGGEVLDAVLHPLHRLARDDGGDDGADVAGIGADLVAEAAADVGRDHVDLVLGDLGDQRGHRADDVRRLERAVDRQLALDLVEGGDALAGLERGGMRAVVGDQLLDLHLGIGEGGIGAGLVAHRPLEDVVVVLAGAVRAGGLAGEVLAQHGRVGRHRLEGIDDDGQPLVFDLDGLHAVGRRVAVLGDDEGDLLVLEQHLAVGQHHLHVVGERRHPGEVDALQLLGGQHRQHARHLQRLGGVDLLDAGVGILRAHEVAEQHAGQLQVVDVVALALREADVLHPLPLAAHAFELGFALFAREGCRGHSAASLRGAGAHLRRRVLNGLDDVLVARAPAQVAGDAEADLLLARVGVLLQQPVARMIMPGVQKPHCRPCSMRKPSCSGCSEPSALAMPSMVVILAPSACTANMVQLFTDLPSRSTVQAPQWVVSQPMCAPVRLSSSRRKWMSSMRGSTRPSTSRPLTFIFT